MSGKREATITISEEEYRRLHEQDMRQRFSNLNEEKEHQQIAELQARVRWLEQRLAAARTAQPAAQVSKQTLVDPRVVEQSLQAPATHQQPDSNLQQRLQIAARLVHQMHIVGFEGETYAYTGPHRQTACVHLRRAADGSQVDILIPYRTEQAAFGQESLAKSEQLSILETVTQNL